jgi:Protein of unknown function (DUF3089)
VRPLLELLAVTALACSSALVTGCAESLPPPQPPAHADPPPPADLHSPFTGFSSPRYADPSSWFCLPGRQDTCTRDISATELLPDGSRVEMRETRLPGAEQVDCFYVYPTIDLRLEGANLEDFGNPAIAREVLRQVARFRSVCQLYVPLYRQTTIGAYLLGPEGRKPYLEVAHSDIEAAFLHYMGQYNRGHKIVLVGHSQGGEMLVHLLKRFFDDDPVMREKLLLAMPIGWPMEVAPGQTAGGTFTNLPVCTHPGETACIIGFRSYVAGTEASPKFATPSPGKESICVNPAELLRGRGAPFSGTYFAPWLIPGIRTPFVMLRDYFRGQCEAGAGGFRYLAIGPAPGPGDVRPSPVDLSSRLVNGDLGMHIFDFQFPQGDLIGLIARSAGEGTPR